MQQVSFPWALSGWVCWIEGQVSEHDDSMTPALVLWLPDPDLHLTCLVTPTTHRWIQRFKAGSRDVEGARGLRDFEIEACGGTLDGPSSGSDRHTHRTSLALHVCMCTI